MLEEFAPNVFLLRYPLQLAGCTLGRTVTVLRLSSGKLLIHSTARFSEEDAAEIREKGEPGWLIEATHFHDTFAKAGRAAFPAIPYLVPPGFKGAEHLDAETIGSKSSEWRDEVVCVEIEGMPKIREHAFFHRASKTLIVADLLFNLPPHANRWTRGFMRAVAGIREYPGMSRFFRVMIKDRPAFLQSMQTIAAWDFERIIVAHGDPICDGAKAKFLEVMARHGFDVAR